MKTRFSVLLWTFLLAIVLSGCGGDNGVTTVGAPAGSGYRLAFQKTDNFIRAGGSVVVTVLAYDPDGNVIQDSEDKVVFSSSHSVTFDNSGEAKIENGVANMQVTYNDNSSSDNPEPSETTRVTATFRGAVASIELVLVSKTF